MEFHNVGEIVRLKSISDKDRYQFGKQVRAVKVDDPTYVDEWLRTRHIKAEQIIYAGPTYILFTELEDVRGILIDEDEPAFEIISNKILSDD